MSHPAPDSPEPFPEDWADRLGKSADQLAGPAVPAAYMKPGTIGCMAVLLSIAGLFIGPLAVAAFAMGMSVSLTCVADRVRPPGMAAFATALGLLGTMLAALHYPSLVNWTMWL